MQDDRTNQDDGAGDQHDTDHMNQRIGEHDTVKQVIALPLFFFSEIGVVDTGSNRGVGGDEGQRRSQTSLGNLEAEETPGEFSAVRTAHAEECNIESQNHDYDAGGDELFDLGIHVFREVGIHNDGDQDERTKLPVDAEDQVHARTAARNVAHCEEQAGEKQRDADDGGTDFSVVLADGVDGGHAGGDGKPVCRHDKGDAHENDREHEPDQRVAIVGTQHGSRGDGAGTDDNACGDEARTDAFQKLTDRQSFYILTDQAGGFLFFHADSPF